MSQRTDVVQYASLLVWLKLSHSLMSEAMKYVYMAQVLPTDDHIPDRRLWWLFNASASKAVFGMLLVIGNPI